MLNRALRKPSWKKIGLGLLSIVLFILAIQLMQDGAIALAPVIRRWST